MYRRNSYSYFKVLIINGQTYKYKGIERRVNQQITSSEAYEDETHWKIEEDFSGTKQDLVKLEMILQNDIICVDFVVLV